MSGLPEEPPTVKSVVGYSPVKRRALILMREHRIPFVKALEWAKVLVDADKIPKRPRKETPRESRDRIEQEAAAEVDRIAPADLS